MDPQTTGRFIFRLRKKAGLTQAELAEKAGVTGAAVSKWEKGRCYPDIETVSRLSAIFSVSIGDILAGYRIDAYTRETVDALTQKSISEYTRCARHAAARTAGAAIALLLSLSLLLIPIAAYRLANLPESGFSNQSYAYESLYHSGSADLGQLVVQYELNGEPCTLAVSVLVEKSGDSVRSVNCIKSAQIEKSTSAFNFASFCAHNEEHPNHFQIIITISAQENGKDRKTTTTETYDVQYDGNTDGYTVELAA